MKERRLDVWLVEHGYFSSREKALGAVMAGRVLVAGQVVTKAGCQIKEEETVQVQGADSPYVSRGGEKLAAALDAFGVDPSGRVALDAGASTGGFTHCLLLRGARLVYAVDVGYGQLAWELRQDPRVLVYERTNARALQAELFPAAPDLGVVDVSFISLDKILPSLAAVLGTPGEVVALVKPQFEAGKGKVGKGGVVRDRATHLEVLERAMSGAEAAGFGVRGMTFSPLKGPAGNIEYFLHLAKGGDEAPVDPAKTVEAAWAALG